MSIKTPDRIVELWPHLTEAARQQLIEMAESEANSKLELSAEEERLLTQSQDDFRHGRTLSPEEYRASMSTFFDRLKAKAKQS